MFRFQTEQRAFRIGGVDFGSQPGRGRTAMVASLFYPGHKLVEDRLSGRVAMDELRRRVGAAEEASASLGQPLAYMLYSEPTPPPPATWASWPS